MEALQDIPGSEDWVTVEPVLKGWSSDQKYYIEDKAGRKLLLRLSSARALEGKRAEFEVVKLFNQLDFPMSQAIDCGVCSKGKYTYMLLTWVEGRPLEGKLADLDPGEQYRLGEEAGRMLKQLHSLPCAGTPDEWEQAMQAKILRRIQEYEECPYRVEGDGQAIAFVKKHVSLIHQVAKVYQHGDFHIGNLIHTPEGGIGVIDFNRWDIGDYAEEFCKLQIFDRERSIPFALGRLKGYFGGEPPEEFWKRQALYVAYVSLFSIQWAVPFGAEDIEGMQIRCRQALEDYRNFTTWIPRWYA
ncbi:aminoglycoside phosphotransferase [Paenibacillus sp. PK3_47]|uniref:aminoglycoside phosphotransferase family protein n=1 Tax=Paenibacillus sp. PK3_47 TaxID=2072642 RepID=UPI00201E72FC|nr:phosphotransferase [Paenibacillus sp. PK3_47]UQZ34890.1 aminoglycoside phosphotransferase [Paenibacillus sp. PK3_47]